MKDPDLNIPDPVVSIIIPAFNEEKFLPRCLDSIGGLAWPKEQLEVIVVDNGSTDSTCAIAESYGAVLLRDPDKTVSGLRNLGAARAKGRILAFVDADCTVAGDWLTRSKAYFEDEALAAWGAPPVVPESATWVQQAWFVLRQKGVQQPEKVAWLESMNLFVRRDLFLAHNGFDESLETCEDVDFSYRISGNGDILSDPAIRVVHLGEAATVGHFIRKELWRGVGNFKGAFRHGISLKELPSLGIPIYFGLFLPFLFVAVLVTGYPFLYWAGLLAVAAPGCAILFKVRHKPGGFVRKSQLLFLVYIYFIVRTLAVLPLKK